MWSAGVGAVLLVTAGILHQHYLCNAVARLKEAGWHLRAGGARAQPGSGADGEHQHDL
jgi:hypothetical protein